MFRQWLHCYKFAHSRLHLPRWLTVTDPVWLHLFSIDVAYCTSDWMVSTGKSSANLSIQSRYDRQNFINYSMTYKTPTTASWFWLKHFCSQLCWLLRPVTMLRLQSWCWPSPMTFPWVAFLLEQLLLTVQGGILCVASYPHPACS